MRTYKYSLKYEVLITLNFGVYKYSTSPGWKTIMYQWAKVLTKLSRCFRAKLSSLKTAWPYLLGINHVLVLDMNYIAGPVWPSLDGRGLILRATSSLSQQRLFTPVKNQERIYMDLHLCTGVIQDQTKSHLKVKRSCQEVISFHVSDKIAISWHIWHIYNVLCTVNNTGMRSDCMLGFDWSIYPQSYYSCFKLSKFEHICHQRKSNVVPWSKYSFQLLTTFYVEYELAANCDFLILNGMLIETN